MSLVQAIKTPLASWVAGAFIVGMAVGIAGCLWFKDPAELADLAVDAADVITDAAEIAAE